MADRLTALALQKLVKNLTRYGNRVSPLHEQALHDLLVGLASQALGLRPGRIAYAVPCGGGKTQGVVALIAAAHELNLPLSFAVSSAQILALGHLKRDLVNAGLAAEHIGLLHSKSPAELTILAAQELDLLPNLAHTGELDCSVMLVSHARIRRAKEMPAYCLHKGRPRSLLIWDESLLTTDASALSMPDIEDAVSRVRKELLPLSGLSCTLGRIVDTLQAEYSAQRRGVPPSRHFSLFTEDAEGARGEITSIPKFGSSFRYEALRTAAALLRLADAPVSVARTGTGRTGDGLIGYTQAIASELQNIAILDASFPVRLLTHDATVSNGTTPAMRSFKRYDRVQVTEHHVSSGKVCLKYESAKVRALAAEVARYIRKLPSTEFVLIFTHKGDDRKSLQTQMQNALKAEGIDMDGKIQDRQRFNWLTWGNEMGLNGMKHCQNVILCGVMRRNSLDLAASMAGLRDDLSYRMNAHEKQAVTVSEVGHCVYQAMNRGACRDADADGMARRMTLAIFAKVSGLREALAASLPGVQWSVTASTPAQRTIAETEQAIAGHLASLPPEVQQASVTSIRRAIGISVGRDAVTKAIDGAVLISHLVALRGKGSRWSRPSGSSRSLFRE